MVSYSISSVLTGGFSSRLNARLSRCVIPGTSMSNSNWEVFFHAQTLWTCSAVVPNHTRAHFACSCAIDHSGSATPKPARGCDSTSWDHRYYGQLPSSVGEWQENLGRAGPLRAGLACRCQREHNHHVH